MFKNAPTSREDKSKICEFCRNKKRFANMKDKMRALKEKISENSNQADNKSIIAKMKEHIRELQDTVENIKKENEINRNTIKCLQKHVHELKNDSREKITIKTARKAIGKSEACVLTKPNITKDGNKITNNKSKKTENLSTKVNTLQDLNTDYVDVQENMNTVETDGCLDEQCSEEGGFLPVKNSRQKTKIAIHRDSVELKNSFQALQIERETPVRAESVPKRTVLIGDFTILNQESYVVKTEKLKRETICKPQANLKAIAETIKEMNPIETLIIQAGHNDVNTGFSEEILNNFHTTIKLAKSTAKNVIINSLIPGIKANAYEYSRVRYLNRGIESLCNKENVMYCNTYYNFDNKERMFTTDGCYLSQQGEYILSTIMNREMNNLPCNQGNVQTTHLNCKRTVKTRIT